jgi:hypothetical protein
MLTYTGRDSSITLKELASPTDSWYNGLTIRITRGAGYGQKRRCFEYDGTTKMARVTPRWDPQVGLGCLSFTVLHTAMSESGNRFLLLQ